MDDEAALLADGLNGKGPAAGASSLPLAVVAVAAGEGLAAIFRDFGVSRVVVGGQSANPSTGELLEAIRGLDAREVLVLPNNPNVVLAARQVGRPGRPAGGRRRDAQRGRGLRRAPRPRSDARTRPTTRPR